MVRPTDENIGSTKRQESRFGRAQRAPQGCRTGMCGINHGRGTKLKNRNRFGTRSEGTVLERGAGSSGRRSACRATADTKIDKLKFLAADGESVTVPQFMPLLWL